MRRSLSGGSGGMGGGGGGGTMLKNVHRVVRAGVGGGAAQEQPVVSPFKTPRKHNLNNNLQPHAASNILTLSAAANVAPSSPFPPSAAGPSSPVCSEESEWECVDNGREDEEMGNYFYDDYVFGAVPSLDEVHHAFSALQQVVFEPAASSPSRNSNTATSALKDTAEVVGIQASSTPSASSDWMEPSLHICNSRMLRPYVPNRVYEAFHLMQTEPAIKRMVVSLSSDQAVWDAVLNNEAVQELRDSLKQVNVPDRAFPGSTYEESVASNVEPDDIWSWIFSNAKAKMMEMIDKVMTFINDLFQPPEREKKASEGNTDLLDQQFRTSFFLSILVLLIVVVSRAQKA